MFLGGRLPGEEGGENDGSTVCGVGCAGGEADEAAPSGPLVFQEYLFRKGVSV